jgi:hypothetical protein
MEAGRHSITALHAAFMRAHHAAHARPTIFADTYAHLMLSASERKSIETRLLEDCTASIPRWPRRPLTDRRPWR